MATITWILISAFVLFAVAVYFYPSKNSKLKKKSKKKSKDADVAITSIVLDRSKFHIPYLPRLGGLIGGFVALAVGLTILPVISNQISSITGGYGTNGTNITFSDTSLSQSKFPIGSNISGSVSSESLGYASSFLKLVPAFFGIAIVIMGAVVIINAVRTLGTAGDP